MVKGNNKLRKIRIYVINYIFIIETKPIYTWAKGKDPIKDEVPKV